ncbi:MAG: glycosyltransferase family 2 protein [Patescibacteria group bacterium]|jgi:glycosyltransferase involved in cell wall biosynthesis
MKNSVSVIIPVYNEEKYLDRCLSTMLDQTYTDLEIIVVDDDSTDNSQTIIKKYPVKYLHQPHRGPAAAKNLGAEHANGDILVFGDGDIHYDKHFIEDLTSLIVEGKAIGTYSKEMYVANPENIWSQCYNINLNLDFHRKVKKDFPDTYTGFKAIKKDLFINAGGFDDVGYGEDLTLYPKIKIKSQAARNAISYHYNPDSARETFTTARWIGRGNNKNPIFTLLRLVKYSLPASIMVGLYKSVKYRKYYFIIFKTVWDFGVLIGIINSFINKQHAK